MRISIVGGGLAGLTCALSLGRAGFAVTLFEATKALGGKAGVRGEVDLLRPDREFPLPCEHGPHFLAAWYSSTLRLVRELGVADRLVDYPGIHYLLPTPPSAASPRGIETEASLRGLPSLIGGRRGQTRQWPFSWRVSSQAASMACDLLLNRSQIEAKTDVSLADHMKGRWYGDEELMVAADDQVLRGSAISVDQVSVRTMARLVTLWLQHPRPFLSVFDSDLDSALIDPLVKAVEAVAQIRLGIRVQGLADDTGGRIIGLRHDDGAISPADVVVAAVPCEVLREWLTDGQAAEELRGVTRLQTAPMCAIQLVFDGKLRGVPTGVFYLWKSQPSINVIDLSQVWRSLAGDGRTFLSAVISDHSAIQDLDEKEQVALVLRQLSRYIPDVARVGLSSAAVKSNAREPLFINTVGSWANRPSPSRAYAGGSLYVAADFVRTSVDIACMESAVAAGMTAAEAIAVRFARSPGLRVGSSQPLARRHRLAYRALGACLAPITAAAKVADRRT